MLGLVLLLCVAAVLTKIVGCGLGALICRYSPVQALRIGCGMISRGEVALIIADKGMSLGILNEFFITPILLKIVYKHKPDDPDFTHHGETKLEKDEIHEALTNPMVE